MNIISPQIIPEEIALILKNWTAGKASRSLRIYRENIACFARFSGHASPAEALYSLLTMGPVQANYIVQQWVGEMMSKKLAPATIANRLSIIRSFVTYAGKLGWIYWKLILPSPRVQTLRNTRGPGRKSVEKLLRSAQSQSDRTKAARDTLLIRLMHDCGLRVGEVLSLRMRDIDLKNKRLWLAGKGSLGQRIPISIHGTIVKKLQDWVKKRPKIHQDALFVSIRQNTRKGLSDKTVRQILKSLSKKAGISHIYPHGLRHTAITEALNKTNGNLREVVKFSRHANWNTLSIYDDTRVDYAKKIQKLIAIK